LRQQLEQQVRRTPASDQASLSPAAADLVLLIGDLQGYVDLGLEEAAFYRAGQAAAGQDLRRTLEAEVFPHLQPEAPRVYTTLRDHYLDLRSDMTPGQLLAWGRGVLGTLTETLGQAGLEARYSLHLDNL
jgi:hypothetical protein